MDSRAHGQGHKLNTEVWGNGLENILAVDLTIEKSFFFFFLSCFSS